MHSWQFKGSKPKSSRWFSWQDTCHEQLREWHGSKLVYMWYLDCYNPDSEQIKNADSFDKLRQASGGGLLLALYSLNQKNWENTHIIQVCTQPCWSAFTRFNTTVKSADDCLNYNLQMQTAKTTTNTKKDLPKASLGYSLRFHPLVSSRKPSKHQPNHQTTFGFPP